MPNKIYLAAQPQKVFADSGDYPLILSSLGVNAGRSSVLFDRGAGSVPVKYKWRAVITWAAAPVAWDIAEIYVCESDGTLNDATWVANASLAADAFLNAVWLGSVYCQTTTSISSGSCILSSRYFMIGVWNRSTSKTLSATANTSKVILTAMPNEIQ